MKISQTHKASVSVCLELIKIYDASSGDERKHFLLPQSINFNSFFGQFFFISGGAIFFVWSSEDTKVYLSEEASNLLMKMKNVENERKV